MRKLTLRDLLAPLTGTRTPAVAWQRAGRAVR
jgi:hypothetical protein